MGIGMLSEARSTSGSPGHRKGLTAELPPDLDEPMQVLREVTFVLRVPHDTASAIQRLTCTFAPMLALQVRESAPTLPPTVSLAPRGSHWPSVGDSSAS